MDSKDAILEHLKKAQQRGVETITNRLSFISERLDELLTEAKSSIREAQPQDPEELFPVSEVVSALGASLGEAGEASARADALAARVAELEQAQPAAVSAGISVELLRRLDTARSQSELLRELLPLLADYAGRAAVLVIRGGSISAWSGIGFADADRLRTWKADVNASEIFQRFATEAMPLRFTPSEDPVLTGWLAGEEMAQEAALIPVNLRGKVVGGIYMDPVGGGWNPDEAQGLVAMVCWLIDTLPYRQTVPSPMLASPEDLRKVIPAEVATAKLEVGQALAEAPGTPDPAGDFDPSATMAMENVGPQMAAMQTPAPQPTPAPTPAPAPTPTPEPAPAAQPASPRPVQPVVPPQAREVQNMAQSDSGLSPEEQAQHDEARRFARLLVSEIKLYNESDAERGRANKDLYQRLKEDIDRSREMFEKRIAPEIRAKRDYFRDELVENLAGGDAEALGGM